MNNKKIRCAIYTRKSTDEKLDLEFNTLDVQREAGEAYIKSQRHEGWELVTEKYDDGGFSGGNTERPALKKLLEHIKLGYIDMVVVYKIDRLTRSLYDFSKMVDLFEQHSTSFVSVTQQFNTSTSMGRLTLNVLLSFAQFEREISGERIRDKIAASKKKGMWMGGPLIIGYDIIDKKLIINKDEAKIVRLAFERFLITQSYVKTAEYLNQQGYTTKSWLSRAGTQHQGKEWTKQAIHKMLRKEIYLGLIKHQDELFKGEHEAIIPQTLWDDVHNILNQEVKKRHNITKEVNTPLLKDLLHCACCNCKILPSYTKKGNKKYNYYISEKAMSVSYSKCKIGSIPANDIENIVINHCHYFIKNTKMLEKIYQKLELKKDGISKATFIGKIRNLDKIWQFLCPAEIKEIIKLLVKKITVHNDKINIEYNDEALIDNFIMK
jgi:DNA invertase Pin-like site-specific DNA recombinase